MGRYGHKSLRYKDFYNFTMAGFGRLRSTDCGSHGRGPRFDPLCVHHHRKPHKTGAFCIFEPALFGSSRQIQAEPSGNRRGKSGDRDRRGRHQPKPASGARFKCPLEIPGASPVARQRRARPAEQRSKPPFPLPGFPSGLHEIVVPSIVPRIGAVAR
jgi:hypothetical protein